MYSSELTWSDALTAAQNLNSGVRLAAQTSTQNVRLFCDIADALLPEMPQVHENEHHTRLERNCYKQSVCHHHQ